jgi:hypothetical protein
MHILAGYRTSAGTRIMEPRLRRQGADLQIQVGDYNIQMTVVGSLEGDVKIWDMRGSGNPVRMMELHPQGLASFDVHSQTGVVAT